MPAPPRQPEYLEMRFVRVASEIIMRAEVTLVCAAYYPDYHSPMRQGLIVTREVEKDAR